MKPRTQPCAAGRGASAHGVNNGADDGSETRNRSLPRGERREPEADEIDSSGGCCGNPHFSPAEQQTSLSTPFPPGASSRVLDVFSCNLSPNRALFIPQIPAVCGPALPCLQSNCLVFFLSFFFFHLRFYTFSYNNTRDGTNRFCSRLHRKAKR